MEYDLDIDHENTSAPSTADFANDDFPEFDLGRWVGKSMTAAQKAEMLKKCWKPHASYNFRDDAGDSNRCFRYNWLNTYAPWLTYSKKLKGALCLNCVLFHKNVVRGVLGALVVKPFDRYKNMNEFCKSHKFWKNLKIWLKNWILN